MNKPIKVGYLTFGRDEFGYGLALVLSKLKNCEIYRITPKTARHVDVLVFSIFWWEHFYCLAEWMRSAKMSKAQKNRPRILVGGFATFNPTPLLAYADAVIVGDGEDVIVQAVKGDYSAENILTNDKSSYVWGNASSIEPFVRETNGIARIELARGCRFGCRFCAVKFLKPYRELSLEGVQEALSATKCKRVSLFAPEPTMHSQDEQVTALCRREGKVRVDSDVRLDRVLLRADSVPRVGIEGLSYRLRKSVNKPYKNEDIVRMVKECIASGRKGLFMYYILDLPGEDESDWEEFRGLLEAIGELPGADKFLLKPSPSVFLPTPYTPMAHDGIHWDRPYGDKWQDFFGRGKKRKWKVLMAERSRVFSPYMRVLSMMATRGGSEFFEVEQALRARKAIRCGERPQVVDGPLLVRELEKRGLLELYCGELEAASTNPANSLKNKKKKTVTI
jgi:radical SAM superfamily enzyme YgiQ (UPF0313 family)